MRQAVKCETSNARRAMQGRQCNAQRRVCLLGDQALGTMQGKNARTVLARCKRPMHAQSWHSAREECTVAACMAPQLWHSACMAPQLWHSGCLHGTAVVAQCLHGTAVVAQWLLAWRRSCGSASRPAEETPPVTAAMSTHSTACCQCKGQALTPISCGLSLIVEGTHS